ncbi:ABC transporter type 1, transmembrane domain-containing protein [Aspergillus recurvatus]
MKPVPGRLRRDTDILIRRPVVILGIAVNIVRRQKQRVSLARALYLLSVLLILDDVFSGLDADTEDQDFRQVSETNGLLHQSGSTVALCTHSVRHLPTADHIIALENGSVAEQGTFVDLSTHPGYVQRLEVRLKQGSEDAAAATEPGFSPKQDETGAVKKPEPATTVKSTLSSAPIAPAVTAAQQVGDTTVYKLQIKSMGWFVAACSLVFAALWGVFTTYSTSDATESDHSAHANSYYAGIYALLQICAIIALLLLGITLFIVSVKKAGANLHQQALRTLIRAPLSFFSNTDTGVTANLFSQDLNLVYTELPEATLNTLFCVFQSIGQAAVMLTSSAYLAISYPILGALLYLVQKYYLRTSRQLRLLDLEAKSPLYTHFIDMIKEIATFRAFGFVSDDIQENALLVDSSQRAAYLLTIQEWLNLVLNLVVMVIAAVFTMLAVRLHSNSALASVYSLMSFGVSPSGIAIYYTRLETSIAAIARLKTFNETVTSEDHEGPGEEGIILDEGWPDRGLIELRGVSARYKSTTVPPIPYSAKLTRRKVAIYGRTGSGKSSFLALLLKLLDPLPSPDTGREQLIIIDHLPLHRIHRATLRQRLVAVPQGPVFLPDGSSFRANLDPSKHCYLGGVLEGSRDSPAVVLCLGTGCATPPRHLLPKGLYILPAMVKVEEEVLLLDEVSSSVGRETERIMQEVIRKEFERYTVIAASHRLKMIMDFDRVVMDRVEAVEIGNPVILRGLNRSRFGELVTAAGA